MGSIEMPTKAEEKMLPINITINNHPATSSGNASTTVTFEEYLALTALMFEWADSYDHKDWARLSRILAPTLHVDYTKIGKQCWPSMTQDEYLAMMSSPGFLGDPHIRTQHLLGATRWEKVSENLVVGHHQLRAAHQVYTGEGEDEGDGFGLKGLGRVGFQGHSHASNVHWYRRVDGVWKFAGLKPEVLWNEGAFEKVFKGSYVD